jgi:hypothetical protein
MDQNAKRLASMATLAFFSYSIAKKILRQFPLIRPVRQSDFDNRRIAWIRAGPSSRVCRAQPANCRLCARRERARAGPERVRLDG